MKHLAPIAFRFDLKRPQLRAHLRVPTWYRVALHKGRRDTSSPQISPWFTREDYPAVKRLSPYDPELPNTFDKWLKQETMRTAKVEAHGFPVKKVVVYSHEIAEYCCQCGFDPNDATRGAFAVVKAHQK